MHSCSSLPPTKTPSAKQLWRSTIFSMGLATVLLFVVVYPAEYGVDITGVGSWLGLTEMGKIKASLAKETRSEQRVGTETRADTGGKGSANTGAPGKSDQMSITLRPGEGAEVKLTMDQSTEAFFEWSADGPINVDTHGESTDSAPKVSLSYKKERQVTGSKGVMRATFTGLHGWFLRNRTDRDVTVMLSTRGNYREIKRLL